MSDSSSSDEEVNIKLLEAVDKDFISDGMFNQQRCHINHDKKEVQQSLPPSLRVVDSDHDNHSQSIGLNLTPEFRNYVGKHLAAMLDKQLNEVEPSETKRKKQKKYKNRVKLLHSSIDYIVLSASSTGDVCATLNAKRKAREEEHENSEEERTKIEEAAVRGDWVTSGEAVKGWVKSTKGEVFVGEHATSLKTAQGKKKKKKKKKEQVSDT